jgi:PAS domain S-box-containing protein
MPLVKEGRLTALMAIHDRVPRAWTEAELNLLREVTSRSWAHVERVAATSDLRASEARLRAVVDAAPVGLVFADSSGRITGSNSRVEEIIGGPVIRSDGIGDYGNDYVAWHADGRGVEGQEYPLARVLRGEVGRAELEVQVPLPGGARRWVRYIATPMRDERGTIIGAVAASLDMTGKSASPKTSRVRCDALSRSLRLRRSSFARARSSRPWAS